jgi:hypothetical protein
MSRIGSDPGYGAPPWDYGAWQLRRQRAQLENDLLRAQVQEQQKKQQATGTEYWYTPQQRQDLARHENAKRNILSSDEFSEADKVEAVRQIDTQIQNIIKNPQTRLIDPNKFNWPEGTGPGIISQDPISGAAVTGTYDAKGNPFFKLIQRKDQSIEYMREQEILKARARMQEKENDNIHRLSTEQIDVLDEKGDVIGSRPRTPEEIADAIDKAEQVKQLLQGRRAARTQAQAIQQAVPQAIQRGAVQQGGIPQAAPQAVQRFTPFTPFEQKLEQELQRRVSLKRGAQQQQVPAEPSAVAPEQPQPLGGIGPQAPLQPQQRQAPAAWWQQAEKSGMTISENDKTLPPQVGAAQAYIRNTIRIYGKVDNIPPEKMYSFLQASEIVDRYRKLMAAREQ